MVAILTDPPLGDRAALEAYLAEMEALPAEVENRDAVIANARQQLRLQDRIDRRATAPR